MRLFLSCLLLVLTFLLLSVQAYAVTPEDVLNDDQSFLSKILKTFNFDSRYRIGDEWGKKPVSEDDLKSNDFFRRMALATAKIRGGGTGFYLGEFNGKYIVATNHHVCPAAWQCAGATAVNFPQLNFRTRVAQFYGSWPEIDLALFSIVVNDETMVNELNSVSSPFAFNDDLYRGQKLLTIGFGVANNNARMMVANQDSDCVVFSGDAEYRLMGDPDELNPGPYEAWSFANGCDVSHGDSGSAMMDRETGNVIGIIWTGRIPKNQKVQSSEYLNGLLEAPTEEIWQELSYGVPAVKMKSHLLQQISNGNLNGEAKEILVEMLQ